MAIDNLVVKEDLTTVVAFYESIESNDDFYQLQRVAREMNLPFIATIDEAGDTVINRLQVELLDKEIKLLRSRTDINQTILDNLQEPVDKVIAEGPHIYIKFVGD